MSSESLLSSSLSSWSKLRTGIGWRVEHLVGSTAFFERLLRFFPVSSLSSSLEVSSIGSLRFDEARVFRPLVLVALAGLPGRRPRRLRSGTSSSSSSLSTSSEEEMPTVVMSTKPAFFVLEVLPRSLMSSELCAESSSSSASSRSSKPIYVTVRNLLLKSGGERRRSDWSRLSEPL